MFDSTAAGRFAAFAAAFLIQSSVALADNLLLNPGAEQGKDSEPSVWSRASVPADGLTMTRTTTVAHAGKASLAISNRHQYYQAVANNWMQSLQDVPHGATIRLSADIRTENADAANVCLQCWDITGEKLLAFATTPVFRGDQEWVRVSSRPLVVPRDTAEIIVRAALAGIGQAWFDELQVSMESAAKPRDEAPPTASAEALQSAGDEELRDKVPGPIVRQAPITKDCMILAYLPDWQHGNVDNLAVANNDGGVRMLLTWKSLPADTMADANRRFYLAVYSRDTTATEGAGKILVSPIAGKWAELTSWKSQPKIAESAAPLAIEFVPGNGWKLFDITPLMRQHPSANRYGVMLKFKEEDRSGVDSNWSGYSVASREALGEWEGRHPRLLVVDDASTPQKDTAATQ